MFGVSVKPSPFSLVIPTYHEADNLAPLLAAIAAVDFHGREFEVLLMDDQSNDGSLELMQHLALQYPWARMIVRNGTRGLSRSIVDGFKMAKYSLLVSMDADLSHPVNVIPAMLSALANADMVMGSRYVSGGSIEANWPWHRRFISRASAMFAKVLLGVAANDPLSGYFAISKAKFLQGNIYQPSGWKIALEVMVKCRCHLIKEIPIHFSDRRYGKSKLTFKVGIAFLKQLLTLCYFRLAARMS